MRKPPITGNESVYRSQVYELWGKITISDRTPLLDDMEVGEVRILESTSTTPSDHKMFVKTNLSTMVIFCGCQIFGAAYDEGFAEGFEVQ